MMICSLQHALARVSSGAPSASGVWRANAPARPKDAPCVVVLCEKVEGGEVGGEAACLTRKYPTFLFLVSHRVPR
jgi:hypothetical protein